MNLFNVALLFFAVSTVNCKYEKVNCESTGVPCWPWEYCKYVLTGNSIGAPTCETSHDIPINHKQSNKCFMHPDPSITAVYVTGSDTWPVACYAPNTGAKTTEQFFPTTPGADSGPGSSSSPRRGGGGGGGGSGGGSGGKVVATSLIYAFAVA